MKFFLFIFATLFLKPAFSQSTQNDTLKNMQLKNAIGVYDRYNADNAPVYNGQEYLYYTFKMEGDPFFGGAEFSNGWVSYSGRKYISLLLMYDIVRNQLIVLSPDKKIPIVMHNEFIDSFSFAGHTFIALKEDHTQNLYNTGFYDLLYNGSHVQFLERHLKAANPRIVGTIMTTSFEEKDRYYIYKNGLYYLVTGKKDVFRVFNDKIHDLKKLMRQNHLKMRHKNFESAAIKVTALYDQLTH